MNQKTWWWFILILGLVRCRLWAGMPSPLPTPFTAEQFPHSDHLSPWIDDRLQALSFFVFATLMVAALVRWLWNTFRKDWPALPVLSYRGALVATLLWGLVSIVVLTMISGARELMTPGAWRKQGWTYRLDPPPLVEPHARQQRRERFEAIRIALLQYAATHAGAFPSNSKEIGESWSIPAHPGFEFLYRPGQTASNQSADVLVFEPEVGDSERFVLLVNGMIGTMRTPELDAALSRTEASLPESRHE